MKRLSPKGEQMMMHCRQLFCRSA